MADHQGDSRIRYEARPTRMFGAYTLWVVTADGAERQVGHGDPHWCIAEARRRNTQLDYTASAAHDAWPTPATESGHGGNPGNNSGI